MNGVILREFVMRKGILRGIVVLTLILIGLKETHAANPNSIHFSGLEVSIGKEHAPLIIVMYYSLTCPHCHIFQKEVLPEIQKKYIDKGLVRFVFRDFPTDGLAVQAAQIAWCLGKDQYMTIAQELLATQSEWSYKEGKPVPNPEKALHDIAIKLGIKEKDYRKCLANQATKDTILRTSFEAQKNHDIKGAPAFIINGELYDGDLTVDTIEERLLNMGIHG